MTSWSPGLAEDFSSFFSSPASSFSSSTSMASAFASSSSSFFPPFFVPLFFGPVPPNQSNSEQVRTTRIQGGRGRGKEKGKET